MTAARAQVGEFSFILAGIGLSLGLIPADARNVIRGGAIGSILLKPLVILLLDRRKAKAEASAPAGQPAAAPAPPKRVVIVGFGRVGSLIGKSLNEAQATYSVIEDRPDVVEMLQGKGVDAVLGNGISRESMEAAGIEKADLIFVTVPNGFEAGGIVEVARGMNPNVKVYGRERSSSSYWLTTSDDSFVG